MDKVILYKIRHFANGEKVIVALYLFGSQASGRVGPMSDIDFAVLFDENLSDKERFKKRLYYMAELSKILGKDEVEVIDLKEASVFFRFEAIKQKYVIFSRSDKVRKAFEKSVMEEYFDRLYYIRRHTKLSLEKMRKEYGVAT